MQRQSGLFNGVIADKTNVFESLKSLVACFRGNMFYTNSEINFTNDRLVFFHKL